VEKIESSIHRSGSRRRRYNALFINDQADCATGITQTEKRETAREFIITLTR